MQAYEIVNCKISTNNYWSHQIITHYKLLCKNCIPILNFIVITPCIFISLPDAFLSFGTFTTFNGNFSLANMSINIQLFSAPMSSKVFISLSCILIANIVPISLPSIILKACSISLQMHSKKYSSGLYLQSSHLLLASPSEASVSSVRLDSSSSGSCIPCMRLTSSSHISCPVTAENAYFFDSSFILLLSLSWCILPYTEFFLLVWVILCQEP